MMFKLLFVMNAVWAGGSVVENGGNYVLCENNPVTNEVLSKGFGSLDIFEGSVQQGQHYKKLSSFRGQRLESAYPKAIKLFFGRWPSLRYEMQRLFDRRGADLTYVDESLLASRSRLSFVAIRKGCTVGQAAIQRVRPFEALGATLPILISRQAWSRFETDQKIALLVHEYLQAVLYSQQNSCAIRFSRDVVGRMLADEASSLSVGDWGRLIDLECGDRPGTGEGN